jgi:sec-independent protein translocase protein TatA
MPMPNIGPLELAIVLVIALVIFGPKRLPDLGRSLGSGMREFKNSITGKDEEEEKLEQTKRELAEPQAPTTESVEADVVTDARS